VSNILLSCKYGRLKKENLHPGEARMEPMDRKIMGGRNPFGEKGFLKFK